MARKYTPEEMAEWLERHMRERLAEIRQRPTRNEAAKQQIIERYEDDLAGWAGGIPRE